MANRIAGNVLIIDSAMGNAAVIVDSQISKFYVNAVAVWSADTTAAILLTGANTIADIIFKHDYPAGVGIAYSNPKWYSFGQAQRAENLKAPIVTAGTAFLYLV